jgi:hypothetical protein
MTVNYGFGLPGPLIWTAHIIFGLFFIYVGYSTLNKKAIPQIVSIITIVLGMLAVLYHTHYWYYEKKVEKQETFIDEDDSVEAIMGIENEEDLF